MRWKTNSKPASRKKRHGSIKSCHLVVDPLGRQRLFRIDLLTDLEKTEISLSSVEVQGRDIYQGRYYDVVAADGKRPIILVHRIIQKDTRNKSEITLHVTRYCRRGDIALLAGKPELEPPIEASGGRSGSDFQRDTTTSLFVSFTDWASLGQECDAESLLARDISEVVTECHVTWKETDIDTDDSLPRYMVKWAFFVSRDDVYFRQIPSDTDQALKDSGELRVVDIFCGGGAGSQGFADTGMRIIAGVDTDWDSGSTFKVLFCFVHSLIFSISTPPALSIRRTSETF